jgi:hypothetical protein
MNVFRRSEYWAKVILKIIAYLFYEVERAIISYWLLTNDILTVTLIWASAGPLFKTPHRFTASSHSRSLRMSAVPNHQASLSPDVETLDSSPTMSFPAILRNPGLPNRYAHLLTPVDTPKGRNRKAEGSYVREKEGKRRIRRRENGAVYRLPG